MNKCTVLQSYGIFIRWYELALKGSNGQVDKNAGKQCQTYFVINVWRKSVFDIYFTEFGAVMTIVLPVLFKYCYKYCYSDSRRLWAVMKGGGLAL